MVKSVCTFVEGDSTLNLKQETVQKLVDEGWKGFKQSDIDTIMDGNQDDIWFEPAWHKIVENAYFIDEDGQEWKITHKGYVFSYCESLMSDHDREVLFST